jgi:CHASE3 domain sensor protein
MMNRSARLAVVAVLVLAMGGAAWEIWSLERERDAGLGASRRFDANIRALAANLAELRGSQQAYVADGQSEGNWLGRATSARESLRAGLTEAHNAARSPEASQAIQAAVDLLSSFEKIDEQARGLVRSEQRLMASDLIFGDSASTIAALAARLDETQARETADADRRLGRFRTLEAATAGAAAAIALVGLLLLLPAGGAARRAEQPTSIAPVPEVPAVAAQPVQPPMPAPDIEGVGALCVEFGRTGDPSALPHLVGRAASLLSASGLIVWMVNPKTGALHPVLSHGYSELALARIGELASDEDNATAEAFRSVEARVVEGSSGVNGAIAVPIVTPAGCVGVLAAEIRNGGEKDKATQAVAAIVAAQLASLSSASPVAP